MSGVGVPLLVTASAAGGAGTRYETWVYGLSGFFDAAYPLPGRLGELRRVTESRTLLSARLLLQTAGGSGSVTIGTTKNGTTIYSIAPTLAFGAGNNASATGTITTTSYALNDLVEVTLTAVQGALLSSGVQIGPEGLTFQLDWSIP